jgi:UDP-galactopyranose mutase
MLSLCFVLTVTFTMIDYLIIGSGLGYRFSEIALQHNKSILVLDNSQSSSRIAGGLYNPVILKRFSEVWQAQNSWW